MRRLIRRSAQVLGLGGLLALAACADSTDEGRSEVPNEMSRSLSGGCSGAQKPGGSAEGEVYGSVFVNGQRSCSSHLIELSPYADAQSRLHMATHEASLAANSAYVNMFEFWDPIAGSPCTAANLTLAGYVANGAGTSERIHAPASPQEGHCVRPGRYLFSIDDTRTFDVEYIQPSGNSALNTATGGQEAIETTGYNAAANYWQDLVINTDFTTTHPGDTPILHIQNSGSNPYAGTFTNQTAPAGTAADWFRFSAALSTSGWTVDGRGSALARLYWNGTDPAQSTAYYDYKPEGIPVLRLHRFPNPVTASKTYTVGLELLRPDEQPANAPSITRTIVINRINPDLSPGTVSGPSSAVKGTSINVTVQHRNLVSTPFATVESGWTGRVYLSTDAVLSPATDVLIGTRVESQPLNPGATVSRTYSATIPTGQATGTYYLLVSLDATGVILESSESNNANTTPPTISVTAIPPLPTITGFSVTSCDRTQYGVKWYNNWTLAWSPVPTDPGVYFDVASGSTNNPASASIIASGLASGGSMVAGPYLDTTSASYRYFWLRFRQGAQTGAWFPLDVNPLDVAGTCAA
jgi:hypothetical protein